MRDVLRRPQRQIHEAAGHRRSPHIGGQQTALGRLFERFIRDSWWVVVFTLATCMVFESGSHQLRREQQRLEGQRQALILDICRESDHRDALHRQIASKDDPAWMERVLIEDLGMVPDGYRKLTLPSTPMEAVPCL